MVDAITTAQTIYYDNQYLLLDQNHGLAKSKRPNFQENYPSGMPRQMHAMQQQPRKPPAGFNLNMNCNQQPFQVRTFNKQEPMEVDNSNRFKQSTNWRSPNQQPNMQTNGPPNREYDSSRQNLQKPYKMQ